MKRPACVVSVCLLVFLSFYYSVRTPDTLEEGSLPEGVVCLEGYVKDRYEKDGSVYLILKKARFCGDTQLLGGETGEELGESSGFDPEGEYGVKVKLGGGSGGNHGLLEAESHPEDRPLSEDQSLPEIGSRVRVEGKVFIFPKDRNPGNFNMALYEKVRGRDFEIYDAGVIGAASRGSPLREALCLVREKLSRVAGEIFEEEEAEVVRAMVLGDRNGLGSEIKGLYRRAGMSHILCISGLHVSIIGLGLLKLFDRTKMRKEVAYSLTVVLLVLYGLLTGAGVSTVRALIMMGIVIAARLLHRTPDILSSMAFACAVVLVVRPLYIFDAGFVLSFAAVTGIGLLGPPMARMIPAKKASVATAMSVSIFMLPLTMYYFYQIPTLSFLINLLAVPAAGIVIVSSAIPLIIGCVSISAASLTGIPASLMLKGFKLLACTNDMIPFSLVTTGRPEIWRIVIYYGLLAAFCFVSERCREEPKRFKCIGTVILVLLLPVAFLRVHRGVTLTMIDVGQGDCHLLEAGGKTMMIDCGSSDVKEVALYRVEPFLLSKGYDCIDIAILTHTDDDHMNGYEEILSSGEKGGVRIRNLVIGAAGCDRDDRERLIAMAERAGTSVYTISSGDSFELGDARVSCLAPDRDGVYADPNEASVCLDIGFGEFRALYTGDVEGEGEERLISQLDDGRYSLLKCAHHGSANSTPTELLESIKPAVAIISAGVKNRYGHPHKELLERLDDAGCMTYVTNKSGAVTLHTDGNSLTVKEHLRE